MPKPKRLSPALAEILRERDIALWDARHFQTAQSTGKTVNSKDPVQVTLMTPRAVDRMFYGFGPDTDAAIEHALSRNSGLNFDEDGVLGAIARLENALHHLWAGLYDARCRRAFANNDFSDLDDDIPF